MNMKNRATPKEIVSSRISKGIRNSVRYKKFIESQDKDIDVNPKTINYQGDRNSQFGTYWITNGVENMKWKNDKGDIPVGYRKGRVMKG